jgi:peptidoglycan hydrolase-like protein with peptidoglycan-binding domain
MAWNLTVRGRALCRVGAVLVVALVVLGMPRPAQAALLGEMSEYRLTLPVAGDHHMWDTFWAWRADGIHSAQDLMAAKGTPVVAAAAGTIRLVNWTSQSHMNSSRCCAIVLKHDDGWESVYIHLDNDTPGTDDGKGWGIADGIAPGARVEAGQLIGYVGDSGTAENTPPHLHFELYTPAGTAVNPFRALLAAGAVTNNPNPSDPLLSGSRLLFEGERGEDVRRLQEMLTDAGFAAGRVDGVFGPRTRQAVRSFQSSAGLIGDGLVGMTTRGALQWRAAPPTAILRQGARGHDVRLLQDRLTSAGFGTKGSDGVFGPNTFLAVLAFQEDSGLRADGLVGPATRAALGL